MSLRLPLPPRKRVKTGIRLSRKRWRENPKMEEKGRLMREQVYTTIIWVLNNNVILSDVT
jgi:hypothetical protein